MSAGDLATWVGSAGTVAALVVAGVVALVQVAAQRRQQLIERTILAHRDITTGEAWGARDRLSEFMWRRGSSNGSYLCWQPTYADLQGASYGRLSDAAVDVSRYPDDLQPANGQTPIRDLYLILWQFERVGVAYRAGLLDDTLAAQMLASHFVWWNVFCARITVADTKYREGLKVLADEFARREPALYEWALADFAARPDVVSTT